MSAIHIQEMRASQQNEPLLILLYTVPQVATSVINHRGLHDQERVQSTLSIERNT